MTTGVFFMSTLPFSEWYELMARARPLFDAASVENDSSRESTTNMTESYTAMGSPAEPESWAARRPRPWQRLSVRLAALFALVTVLAVGAVGLVTYERQQREVQDTVGTQLLNIARVTTRM